MDCSRIHLRNRTCPECGKPFFCTGTKQWIYKHRHRKTDLYFCSYGCMRHFETRTEEETRQRRRKDG